MKYQKSMMKIMENLLFSRKENSIGSIIKETKTGRNSAFGAVKWLEKNGFIKTEKRGNQVLLIPVIDNYTIQYKYYLDSIGFKTLNPLVKLVMWVFILSIAKEKKIKSVVLFGSSLKGKEFNDIDILLLGNSLDNKFISSLSKVRDKIERTFEVVINLHKGELSIENLFKGLVVYQSSYLELRDKTKIQYLEFMDWVIESLNNQNSKEFGLAFNNAILNLSYAYCYSKNIYPETKSDALENFNKKYKVINLADLKKIGVEVGKEIFG